MSEALRAGLDRTGPGGRPVRRMRLRRRAGGWIIGRLPAPAALARRDEW